MVITRLKQQLFFTCKLFEIKIENFDKLYYSNDSRQLMHSILTDVEHDNANLLFSLIQSAVNVCSKIIFTYMPQLWCVHAYEISIVYSDHVSVDMRYLLFAVIASPWT